MKERLLVLGKSSPIVSKSYEHLVCIAGITEKGEWRRIYPIPWKAFWKTSGTKFKKKSWIEYELVSDKPSNHRVESRKLYWKSITPLHEEKFSTIKKLLDERLTTLEDLQSRSHREVSLGVIKPIIKDFREDEHKHYEELKRKQTQLDLSGESVVKIAIPEKQFSYVFDCNPSGCGGHDIMCEDWELGELYRHCEAYRKKGKYPDRKTVFEKVKRRMVDDMLEKKELYFIVGTHNVYGTYLIISLLYPKKTDCI